MPNAQVIKDSLRLYLAARIPLIVLRTTESKRARLLLRQIADELQTPFYVHGLATGIRDLRSDQQVNDDKSLVGLLEDASTKFAVHEKVTYVVTDAEQLRDDSPVARQFKDVVLQGIDRSGSIVVVTNEPVWSDLQSLGMSLRLDFPDVQEMEAVVRTTIEPYQALIPVEWEETDFLTAARMLAGVSQVQAENICSSIVASGAVKKKHLTEIAQMKDGAFSEVAGLERVTVRQDELSIGGLDALKSWLERKKPLLTADLAARDIRPPRGVLLVGVPGCGKSLSAKAVAGMWELPLYRLDIASVFGQFVGQSESRLREALEQADSAAPCILWIDEIEKGLAGGGTDSTGVTTRLIGQFLYWLQESPHRVFVVATANDVSKLPPELLRRGRFDELFSIDLPTPAERAEILHLYLDRRLQRSLSEPVIKQLVDASEGFTGADIEAAAREAGEYAFLHGDEAVDDDLLLRIFRNVVPLSKTNPERIEAIRAWGRERAVAASGATTSSSPQSQLRVVIGVVPGETGAGTGPDR